MPWRIPRLDLIFTKTFALLSTFFVLQLIIGTVAVYHAGISQVETQLQTIDQLVHSDISYKNGTWDLAEYNTDPEVPGQYRLYVITKDGFVIDRWRPIAGYLDTSDMKQLLLYQSPKTEHTITGQTWRLLSLPIHNTRKDTIGVVAVGCLVRANDTLSQIDAQLLQAASTVSKGITVQGGSISTDNLDLRNIPYDISYQIVDQYNKIQAKSNTANNIDRLPNYIDPSYIAPQLQAPTLTRVTAANAQHETFLVESSPLTDASGSVFGAVIVARTISPIFDIAKQLFIISGLTGALLLAAASLFLYTWRHQEQSKTNDVEEKLLHEADIQRISFSKSEPALFVNKNRVDLTYATNQYYLCLALFSAPRKKWETGELLEKFGFEVDQDGWRKIYDAMSNINRKTHEIMEPRLIIVSNKTYQINPSLVALIQK